MTGRELFEELQKAGLEDMQLTYPNYIYEMPRLHLATVDH